MSISIQKVYLMVGFPFCSKKKVNYMHFLSAAMMQISESCILGLSPMLVELWQLETTSLKNTNILRILVGICHRFRISINLSCLKIVSNWWCLLNRYENTVKLISLANDLQKQTNNIPHGYISDVANWSPN